MNAERPFRGPADPFSGQATLCQHDDCQQRRIVWNYGAGPVDPVLCHAHLSKDQRQALAQAIEQVQAKLSRLAQDPECWSWPVPPWREFQTEAEADEALHLFQLHRGCAICGSRSRIVEDHDHKTGLVRGNLCHTCNIKEGKGYSTPPFVKYRERNPAAILGVKVRYCSPFFGYAEPEDAELTEDDWKTVRAASDRIGARLPSLESLRSAEPLPQEANEA